MPEFIQISWFISALLFVLIWWLVWRIFEPKTLDSDNRWCYGRLHYPLWAFLILLLTMFIPAFDVIVGAVVFLALLDSIGDHDTKFSMFNLTGVRANTESIEEYKQEWYESNKFTSKLYRLFEKILTFNMV